MFSKKLFKFTFLICCYFSVFAESVEVKTVFGPIELKDELFKIYNMKHMQRLKGVDQSGTPAYWHNIPKFNRLDHSLDVLWLVKNFGGIIKEQIAALVHDISHTAFSHVADIVFGKPGYQDTIHEWFLQQTEIAKLICGLDLTEKDIIPENPEFKRLEQPLPDMCADRIAYNIHTALILKMINESDVQEIIRHLRFNDGKWFFTSRKVAKKFADIPLKLIKKLWCSPDDAVIYHITSLILKRAFQLQRVTKEDMNFCTDQEILDKLAACDDPTIKRYVAKAKFVKKFYRILKKGEGTPDFVPKFKFRGIDPWVYNKHTKKFKRLTELDKKFAKKFADVKRYCENPPKIQLQIN